MHESVPTFILYVKAKIKKVKAFHLKCLDVLSKTPCRFYNNKRELFVVFFYEKGSVFNVTDVTLV